MNRIAKIVGSVVSRMNNPRLLKFQETEYSEISGIVATAFVADPQYTFRLGRSVALDFTDSFESLMYIQGFSCPWEFQNPCLTSLFPENQTSQIEIKLDEANVFPDYQIRQVTSQVIPHNDRTYEKKLIKYRDVQGALAVGPESRIMQGRVMAIRDTDSGPVVEQRPAPDASAVWVDIIPGTARWEFIGASFTIRGEHIDERMYSPRIVIDPGNPDIIIPLTLVSHIFPAGRLTDARGFDISFQLISGRHVISVRKDQLVVRGLPGYQRVVVSADTDDVIMGRPLIRSLSELVLDQPRRRIGFTPNHDQNIGTISFSEIVPKPFYGRPHLTADNRVVFSAARPGEPRLVYAGLLAISRTRLCHTFVSVDHLGIDLYHVNREPYATRTIESTRGFLRSMVDWTNRFLTRSFRFEISPEGYAFGIEINDYFTHSEVCTFGAELDLPKIKPFIAGDDETMCRICFDDYNEGDYLQGLHGCQHTYHEHCLKEWLDVARVATCPTCLKKIGIKAATPRE